MGRGSRGKASRESTRRFEEIAREILAEAKAVDEAEDELYGDQRGDELPEQLRTREGRAEFFSRVREERAAETGDGQQQNEPGVSEPVGDRLAEYEFDVERIVARVQGREGWSRDARRDIPGPPLSGRRDSGPPDDLGSRADPAQVGSLRWISLHEAKQDGGTT
jgi:hypothetical protein